MKKLRNEKPELSKKSSFYITKYRYYELKNFCLQYAAKYEQREMAEPNDPNDMPF